MNYKIDLNKNQLTAMLSVCDVYSYLVQGDFNLAIKTVCNIGENEEILNSLCDDLKRLYIPKNTEGGIARNMQFRDRKKEKEEKIDFLRRHLNDAIIATSEHFTTNYYTIAVPIFLVHFMMITTESYMRLSIIQFDTAFDMVCDFHVDEYEKVRKLCDTIKREIFGYERNSSYSSGSKEVSEKARIVHDIYQTIRHRVSWDEKPQGGSSVNFCEPLKTSQEHLVSIRLVGDGADITKDGWSRLKPTEPGKYKARFADKTTTIDNNVEVFIKDDELWIRNEEINRESPLEDIFNMEWKKVV